MKSKTAKLVALILACVMLLGLTACGGKNASEKAETPTEEQAAPSTA